ncbi:hypothetical protein NPIL_329041 [Nephila pilipes]|uniref:Uncharacterized protein n=1 Tax=Nephila pilipes TaxID=299642 RepID=A0A8X6UEL7_NEPPI|nr:hypothetical protein NPIL_329041 [Nephila pilipes]
MGGKGGFGVRDGTRWISSTLTGYLVPIQVLPYILLTNADDGRYHNEIDDDEVFNCPAKRIFQEISIQLL